MSHIVTKPTKWPVRPAKTRINLGIRPVWSVFAVRLKNARVLSYPLSTQRRLIRLGECPGWFESDWADAQADLTLRWAHVILLILSWVGSYIYMYMSHVMRKAVLCHKRTTKTQISMRIHSLIGVFVIPCLDEFDAYIRNLKTLASFWSWAGRFES